MLVVLMSILSLKSLREVSQMSVSLDISNNGEDAFRPVLFFELPNVFFNPFIQNVS